MHDNGGGDDQDTCAILAREVVGALRNKLIDADKLDTVVTGVRVNLVQAVAEGLIAVPGAQQSDRYQSRGTADPLYRLACTLEAVDVLGEIDWEGWFPYARHVAVTQVFGVLIQAVDDGTIALGPAAQ